MTYEKYCQRVEELYDGEMTRKSITKVSFKLMFIYAIIGILLGYLSNDLINYWSWVLGIGAFWGLTFTTFDYISESREVFDKWSKFSKFWWLVLIIGVVLTVLIKLNFR